VKTGVFYCFDFGSIFFGNVWKRCAKRLNLPRICPDDFIVFAFAEAFVSGGVNLG
jgi:hypothetical protein